MPLHIISGKFKGRPLKSSKSFQTRPTTSLLRKAVFDILYDRTQNAIILDVFAGSGAIGLEALSRGAKEAIFIENDKQALKTLFHNIASLNMEQCTTIYPLDALKALEKLIKQKKNFDMIYIDPPYHNDTLYQNILKTLNHGFLLNPEGFLFIEAPIGFSPCKTSNFIEVKQRRFGNTMLYQYIPQHHKNDA